MVPENTLAELVREAFEVDLVEQLDDSLERNLERLLDGWSLHHGFLVA
jgi:hypothetical protein